MITFDFDEYTQGRTDNDELDDTSELDQEYFRHDDYIGPDPWDDHNDRDNDEPKHYNRRCTEDIYSNRRLESSNHRKCKDLWDL